MIYVIQPEPGGPVKIGFVRGQTKSDVWRRIAALEPGCPWPYRLLATIEGGRWKEGQLHARFDHLRIHREWFRLDGELALWLRGLSDQVGPPNIRPVESSVIDMTSRRKAALRR